MFELTADASHTLEVKKSRFLANALRVEGVDAAMSALERLRATPATHHCWAYRIADQYRSSDDGEPSGSAGRPILAAIDHHSLTGVMVVVTRWYGGINLGVGGLVRAYGGCAAECLRLAPKHRRIPLRRLRLHLDPALSAQAHGLLQRHQGIKQDERYVDGGWRWTVQLPDNEAPAFQQRLRDLSRGTARIESLDE